MVTFLAIYGNEFPKIELKILAIYGNYYNNNTAICTVIGVG